MRNQLILLLALYAVLFGKLAYFATDMPQRMATHFGAAGQANDWMSGGEYLVFMAAFGLLFPLVLPGICALLPKLHNAIINLPRRDYWLAPARRAETTAYMLLHSWWLACLELALVIVLHDLVVDANRHDPPRMSNAIWLVLVVFLSGTAAWVWTMLRHFRLPALDRPHST